MSTNNPVTHAIRYIKNRIPREILSSVFSPKGFHGRRGVASVDSAIIENVIEGIIYPDCAIIGGREENIDLRGIRPYQTDRTGAHYRIPFDRTFGKKIISVSVASIVDISYYSNVGHGGGYVTTSNNAGQLGGILNSILSSTSNRPPVTIDVVLVDNGQNCILVPNLPYQTDLWSLRCILENDKNFRHIHPKSYNSFAKLCLYACQMYIYNNSVIALDRGKIESGSELGSFKEIIDGYSDAAENYDTYLREEMEVVFMLNDPLRADEYYGSISGGKR